ncbi:rhodanese-like domain-containing protein, partial [Streptomyces sp. NPDC127077]|uniref:rhodanese-like domain-containing protein n=1 Tax=Streptomyces sp. NPDC127077 TaxID=3347131 RepID=UPI00365237A0
CLREGDRPRAFRRADFAGLAQVHTPGETVVLDVRRDSERAGGHIAGSVHIPVHQVRDRLGEIPAGTVWVHCAGGVRAAVAASLLDATGRDVVAVDDAFAAAAASGLPMTRSAPTRPGAPVTPAEAATPTGLIAHAGPADSAAPIGPATPAAPAETTAPADPGTASGTFEEPAA